MAQSPLQEVWVGKPTNPCYSNLMTGLSQCVIQGAAPKDVPETLVNINKALRILILSSQHDYITPELWHLYQHRDHF